MNRKNFVSKAKITDIAEWFMLKEEMSSKKIQNLCYYAEAWCEVLYNHQITSDAEFQACFYGPRNQQLYDKLGKYEWRMVTVANPKEAKERLGKILTGEQIDVLESVWETYKDYGGDELEWLIHGEEPWLEKRRDNATISRETMKKYYTSQMIV